MSASADIRRISAEYVIGTLDAAERAAWRARMAADPDVAALVRMWEERFAPLHELSAPASPPADLFADIIAALPVPDELGEAGAPLVGDPHVPADDHPADAAQPLPMEPDGIALTDAPERADPSASEPHVVPPVHVGRPDVPPDEPSTGATASAEVAAPPEHLQPPSVPEEVVLPSPSVAPEADGPATDAPSDVVPPAPAASAHIIPEAADILAADLSGEKEAVSEAAEPAAADDDAELGAAPISGAPSSDPPAADSPPTESASSERKPDDAEPAASGRSVESTAPAVEFSPRPAGAGADAPIAPDVRPPPSAQPVETGEPPPNPWRRLSGVLMLVLLLGAGGFAYREFHRPDPAVPVEPQREASLEPVPPVATADPPDAVAPTTLPDSAAQVPVPPPAPPEPVPEAFAVLGPQPVPAVGLAFDPDTGLVSVLKVSIPPRPGMHYDLWIVTAQAGTRHLAGFREPGAYVSDLLPALTPAALADALLIVTEEPDGNAPAASPTGTPHYSGMAVRR